MKPFHLAFLVAVALMLGRPVLAQPATPAKPETPNRPQTPARPGEARMDPVGRMQEVLDTLKLTDDQKAKVKDTLAGAREAIQKIREEARDGDRREAARKMVEKMRTVAEEVRGVLTAEQKTAFDEKLQAAREELGRRLGGAGGGERPAAMLERMKQALGQVGLSDEQKEKAKALGEEIRTKAQEIISAGGEQAREKLQALREETMNKIKTILSEEQFKKFEELMKQPAPGGARPGEGRGGDGRIGAMLQRFNEILPELKLTDEQKPKVKAALDDAKKRFEDVREQFKDNPTAEAARDKLRQTFDDLRTEFQSILTPDQLVTLRSLMPGGQRGEGERPRRANPDQK